MFIVNLELFFLNRASVSYIHILKIANIDEESL